MTQSTNHQGSHKILVVGGSGFLGAKILGQLTQDATLTLRAMSRRGAPADANSAVQWVRGDLMEPTTLDAALKGVDVVVSSASLPVRAGDTAKKAKTAYSTHGTKLT